MKSPSKNQKNSYMKDYNINIITGIIKGKEPNRKRF